jgi:hypothetical protein
MRYTLTAYAIFSNCPRPGECNTQQVGASFAVSAQAYLAGFVFGSHKIVARKAVGNNHFKLVYMEMDCDCLHARVVLAASSSRRAPKLTQ